MVNLNGGVVSEEDEQENGPEIRGLIREFWRIGMESRHLGRSRCSESCGRRRRQEEAAEDFYLLNSTHICLFSLDAVQRKVLKTCS